jgi:hypothetical protein
LHVRWSQYKFLFTLIGCLILAVAGMSAIGGLGIWYFIVREGAYFGGTDSLQASRVAAHVAATNAAKVAQASAKAAAAALRNEL